LDIREGVIRKISGGLDAEYLRDYLAFFGDPQAYSVSHLGWGLQKRATWTALGMYKDQSVGMDGRAFYGNFLFSTGPTPTRTTPCHLDMPMRNCSFYVDGTPMVVDGDVTPADQKV
jgi:2,5-dihydroxypyridine 5,6-dioxygenase